MNASPATPRIPTALLIAIAAAVLLAGVPPADVAAQILCRPPGGQCSDGTPCTSDEHCASGPCSGGAPSACTDADPCTVESCHPTLGCVHTAAANGASCDDGNLCNGIETCQSGACTAGQAPSCDDGSPCTTDGCQPAIGCTHSAIAGCCTNDAACSDGNPCTGVETCRLSDHTCQPGTPTVCDDGNPCNGVETCRSDTGTCTNGSAPNCDDGVICTSDSCVPETGCTHTPIAGCCIANGNCDDGNACNGVETCNLSTHTCTAGTPPTCDDGNACNGVETCAPASGCQSGVPPVCDDGIPCTADACDPQSGCTHTPIANCCATNAACDDGNACNGVETCDLASHTCQPGTPIACSDGNACNGLETCNPATGGCQSGAPLACDDGNACTADGCDPASGCHHANVSNGVSCADGTVCNGAETCQNGQCTAGTPLGCADANPCTADSCDPVAGCQHAPQTGTSCSDGNACNGAETCQNGACTAGTPLVCDDGNVCTTDSCDPVAGCTYANNTAACSDGNACTVGDACSGGACVPGATRNCNDNNPCTDDLCDSSLGCVYFDGSSACNDGNTCSSPDVCNGGSCVGGNVAAGCTPCQATAIIPGNGGTFVGQTSGTNSLSGSCGVSGVSPERVYQWTPFTTGTAVIQTCGGGTFYDTVVHIHSSTCSGPELACNDDTAGCGTGEPNDHHGSKITLPVTGGQSYYIVVDGYNGAKGAFTLTVTPPTTCGNNVREGNEQCDGTDVAGCSTGQCTPACNCTTPPGGLPDLVPEIADVQFQFNTTVAAGDVAEGCAESTGSVDLMRFTVRSRNNGNADFVLGNPQCPLPCDQHPLAVCTNPEFICSPAQGHNHPHYSNYARYELLDANNQALVVGHKQGFCLLDSICAAPKFDCNNQGLTAGCADQYSASLGCQYLDITGVPAGNYTLRVTVDPFNRIAESVENNNVTAVPVTIVRGTPTATPTPTVTATRTATPTVAATATRTPTPTATGATPTGATATTTPTATASPASTATPTATPTVAATATPVAGGCAGVTVIPAAGGVFNGTTSGTSTLAGSCATSNNSPERVYQWTPAVSGVATIQTCSTVATSFDSVVYLRTGSCASGTEVACNDDTTGCFTSEPNDHHGSRLTPTVTAGQTYFIVVDGYNGNSGSFSLLVNPPGAPTATPTRTATPTPTRTPTSTAPTPTATPGAACAAATVIPAAGGTFSGVTSGASSLAGTCATSNNSPEKVYQWTPTTSGTATFATCGTATLFDTVVYLRSATCQSGTQVACNDDTAGCATGEPNDHHGSRFTATVTAGQTYFIVVDGYNGGGGAFSLTVTPPP